MIEDLVVAAVNQALDKIKQTAADEMAKLAGGLDMPGLNDTLVATRGNLDRTARTKLLKPSSYRATIRGDVKSVNPYGPAMSRLIDEFENLAGNRPQVGRTAGAFHSDVPGRRRPWSLAEAIRTVKTTVRPCAPVATT